MANTKEFFIKINGIQESAENVSTLRDQLDSLSKACVEVNKASRTAAAGSDELSRAQVKIIEYNAEYQKALQSTKAELSARNKAVKESVTLEQSWKTVQEGTLETYRDKQRMITAIGNILKSTNAQTDEEKAKLEELRNQYVQLNDELKEFDSTLGNHQRNVGNYTSASQDLKGELADITSKMAELLANGTSKLDPEFQNLAKRAGEIKDAIGDAREEIGRFASDTKVLDDVVNLASSATNAFQLWQGVTSMLGVENENLLEVMQRLQSIQAVTQAISNLSTAMQGGTATAKALNLVMKATGAQLLINQVNALKATAAQTGMTAAQKAGAIASKALGVALKSIPLMLVIGLVLELVTNWKGVVKWFEDTIPAIKNMNTWFNKVMATIRGVGNAVLNWLVNPIKTFAKTMVDLVNLDFKKAWEDIKNGIDNQLQGTVDAYTKGYEKSMDSMREREGRNIIAQKQKEIEAKLEVIRAKEKYDKKYSDQRIALEKKNFLYRKALASRNKEEFNKIKAEEAEFDATVENQKTKAHEQGLKNRQAANKKAAAEFKRQQQEEEKLEQQRKKAEEQRQKLAIDLENARLRYSQANRDSLIHIYDEEYDYLKNKINEILDFQELDIWNKIDIRKIFEDQLNGIKDDFDDTIEDIEDSVGDALDDFYQGVIEADDLVGLTADNIEERIEGASERLAAKLRNDVDAFMETVQYLVDKGATAISAKAGEEIDKIKENFVHAFKVGFMDIDLGIAESVDWESVYFDKVMGMFESLKYSLDPYLDNLSNAKTVLTEIARSLKISDLLADTDKITEESYGKLYKLAMDMLALSRETQNSITEIEDEEKREREKREKELTKAVIEQINKRLNYLSEMTEKQITDIEKKQDPKKNASIIDRLFNRKQLKQAEADYRASWDIQLANMEASLDQMKMYWDTYLQSVITVYGTQSEEYAKALNEQYKALKEYTEKMDEVRKASQGEDYEKPVNLSNESFLGINKNILNGTANDKDADADKLYKDMQATYEVLAQNVFDPLYQGFSALLEFQIEEAQEKLDQAEKMHDESVDRLEASQRRVTELNDLIRQSTGAALEEFKKQQADEMLLLAQREAEEKRLAREKEKAEKELQKREKKMKKLELQNDLVSAIANVALGVTKAWSFGPILGPIFSAIVAAMGGLQVALIAKQLSKMKDGGLLKGPSHSQGGIPVGNTGIEVEGGEFVVNKRSTAKHLSLLDALNAEGNGGKHTIIGSHRVIGSRYADGGSLNVGQITSSLQRNNLTGVIDAIDNINFTPEVSVVEFNRVAKRLVKVRELAGANS